MIGAPTLAAAAVSVGVPATFLYLVRRLDLYGSSAPRAVALCVWWGMAAFVAAYGGNVVAARWVPLAMVVTVVAPVLEELVKSAVLVDQVRRPSFTYFVDGAVLGFAAGTGFAVLENLLYLSRSSAADGLGLSVNRVLSTSLMHGTTCALVGIALGRLRFGRTRTRAASLVGGLAAAMALHLAYNHWTSPASFRSGGLVDPVTVLAGAIVVGVAGLAGVGLLIRQGLREERRWIRAALDLDVGVTPAEVRAVDALRQVHTLLAPVGAHFGAVRQAEVTELVRLQARLGLKRQAAALATDADLKTALTADTEVLRREMDARQRAIGLYVMAYVRSVWPDPGDSLWRRLDEAVAAAPGGGHNVWAMLDERAGRGS
jgi:protease PrsW